MLMRTLPFVVRDLVAHEVLGTMYVLVYKSTYFDILLCTSTANTGIHTEFFSKKTGFFSKP